MIVIRSDYNPSESLLLFNGNNNFKIALLFKNKLTLSIKKYNKQKF